MKAEGNSKDTVVDTVAKMLSPEGVINWHIYRDWARSLLKPAAALKDDELAAVLAAPDREITHEELLLK